MYLAKGLEFRAVIVMACDEDLIPNAQRIQGLLEVILTASPLLLSSPAA
jgi:superfamily I DNA/RNA helicase